MNATSVVIGVDFSPPLSRAGEWIRRYIAPSASITLVHAYEPAAMPAFLSRLLPEEATRPRRNVERLERQLVHWREENGIRDAHFVVRSEPAHGLIRRVARETDAELVVIGARAASDRPWLRLGTTAERLLRTVAASVLVIHGRPRGAPRTVLVAVDDVAITPRVLGIAGELADRFDARVHAIHVVHQPRGGTEDAVAPARSQRWLDELRRNTLRHDKLEVEVAQGVPSAEILAAAERVGAELIVIGRYGAGHVAPAVLGSVVGSVVHGANCPVLVVAEEQDE
jgi:nucleotide-binding universal stress UspA family protein